MNWHYVSGGQSVGPISDAELERLVQAGTIQPDTLVWKDGMAEWKAYSQISPAQTTPPPPLAPSGTGSPGGSAAAAATHLACSQCGKVLPVENLVSLNGSLVCASCKPLFVQKMREGLPSSVKSATPMEYAGFGTRLLAKILDALILGLGAALIIGIAAAILIPLGTRNQGQAPVFFIGFGLAVLVVLFGTWFYQIWCLPKYGGTPGKRILNIKVVTAEGGPISWGRSFGRFFAEMLNGLIPLWIGYIIALFDEQRRTVHDHLAGTRVVKG